MVHENSMPRDFVTLQKLLVPRSNMEDSNYLALIHWNCNPNDIYSISQGKMIFQQEANDFSGRLINRVRLAKIKMQFLVTQETESAEVTSQTLKFPWRQKERNIERKSLSFSGHCKFRWLNWIDRRRRVRAYARACMCVVGSSLTRYD